MYEFTASDLNEVATALKQDVIVPGAAALKHKLQVIAAQCMEYFLFN